MKKIYFLTAILVCLIVIFPFMCAKAQDTIPVRYGGGISGLGVDSFGLKPIPVGQWRVSTGLGAYWANSTKPLLCVVAVN